MAAHPWTDLPILMARLDDCLAAAVPNARARFGIEPGADPYRGLYVGDELVEQLVSQPLERFSLGGVTALDWPPLHPALGSDELDPLEVAVATLALAPEVDLKYERIYGYLQDDVSARRPRVSLALDLFCSDLQSRLAARDRFSGDAPLRRQRIISLGGHPDLPLLARPIALDPQVIRHLLGGTGLDERLAEACELLLPGPVEMPIPLAGRDEARCREWTDSARAGRLVRIVLCGPDLPMLGQLAAQLAGELDLPLLRLKNVADSRQLVQLLAMEGRLLGHAIHVEWQSPDPSWATWLLDSLAAAGSLVIVTTNQALQEFDGRGFDIAEFGLPAAGLRRQWWEISAAQISESDLDRLAARYRLTGSQISLASSAARMTASPAGEPVSPSLADLAAAARRQSGHRLEALAQRIIPMARWDDLVLPANATAALHELCDRVSNRHTVLRKWGMDARTNGRLGINALFAGPSGTGKTMAAQVVAADLELDLFAIDLSGVVSKYIGETEKNLDAIFTAAENTDAVLLFDEADSLFGKRSEVRDSHDRYANLEVSYLLQRMESHDGVAILATNLRQNLDEAFLRRLAFSIRFPFPEEQERRQIWNRAWPDTVPMAGDIDFDLLANRYKFSGGNIRNVAVCAAFLAAADGRSVSFRDVLAAVDREFDKLGGTLTPAVGLHLAEAR